MRDEVPRSRVKMLHNRGIISHIARRSIQTREGEEGIEPDLQCGSGSIRSRIFSLDPDLFLKKSSPDPNLGQDRNFSVLSLYNIPFKLLL